MDRFSGGTAEGRQRVCSEPAACVVGHAMVIDGGQTV